MTKQAIIKILDAEQLLPTPNVTAMCDKIKARHENRVQAFLYYGSSLRAMNDPDKILDFYVLVDSYRKTHKNPVRVLLNWMIPPAVYYLENQNEDGTLSTCKYSIISLPAFERKCTGRAFLSMVWGRFSQPCVLLFAKDQTTHTRIQTARADAVEHIAKQTSPLVDSPITATKFWARGFLESYKTELRPERSDTRSEEIVTRYQTRYDALMAILYGAPNQDGAHTLPPHSIISKTAKKSAWFARRIFGKIMAAIRILNTASTFDGGLDYALHKLKSHSGVTIDVTPSQRKHPVLWSPVLAWKLYKRGAFR
ncbi:MAG: hypothetical protein L3J65_10495 [Robiginitomaculum sp.]|nr:hypothetical protein [Robiginitomaculum sp.]